jgi:transposase-like protein
MLDHIVDSSKPRGRVDIQVGDVRRRKWSDEVKGRIVAESSNALAGREAVQNALTRTLAMV